VGGPRGSEDAEVLKKQSSVVSHRLSEGSARRLPFLLLGDQLRDARMFSQTRKGEPEPALPSCIAKTASTCWFQSPPSLILR